MLFRRCFGTLGKYSLMALILMRLWRCAMSGWLALVLWSERRAML